MKEVKALAVMTRPELEKAMGQMNVLIRELRVTIRNHAQSIRGRDAVIKAAEKRRAELEMALTTIADHRTQLSWAACSRIARAALAATEPKPEQAG